MPMASMSQAVSKTLEKAEDWGAFRRLTFREVHFRIAARGLPNVFWLG